MTLAKVEISCFLKAKCIRLVIKSGSYSNLLLAFLVTLRIGLFADLSLFTALLLCILSSSSFNASFLLNGLPPFTEGETLGFLFTILALTLPMPSPSEQPFCHCRAAGVPKKR